MQYISLYRDKSLRNVHKTVQHEQDFITLLKSKQHQELIRNIRSFPAHFK